MIPAAVTWRWGKVRKTDEAHLFLGDGSSDIALCGTPLSEIQSNERLGRWEIDFLSGDRTRWCLDCKERL